jgi:peptide/nickel transport system permease protein
VDALIVASIDAVSSFPALLVVVAAQGLLGAGGVAVAIVIIALPRAADTARLVRAELRAALAAPFCDAARALGVGPWRLVVRHALPHAIPQLGVASALTCATAVLAEAALSFLGFGTPAPAPSWGELLRQAHDNGLAWWLMLPSGAAVAIAAAALGALAQPRGT